MVAPFYIYKMKEYRLWNVVIAPLIVFLLSSSFLSCESNNDDDSYSDNTIVGTWYLANRDGTDMIEYGATLVISFHKDGSATQTSYYKDGRSGTTLNFTYHYDSETGIATYKGTTYQGKVIIEGDTMTIYGKTTDIYRRINETQIKTLFKQ